ncbi:MAG TPA: hypothetical protein DEO62_05760, partial [Lachnospiraceae bacterium]|nr:hypothetical protein [Lachnospiraceae bacterium]
HRLREPSRKGRKRLYPGAPGASRKTGNAGTFNGRSAGPREPVHLSQHQAPRERRLPADQTAGRELSRLRRIKAHPKGNRGKRPSERPENGPVKHESKKMIKVSNNWR